MLWLADALNPLLVGAIPLLVLLFPTGRVPSRGWWPVAWLTVAATGLLAVENALYPRDLGGDPRLPKNPAGMPGAEDILDTLGTLALVLLLVVALASLLAVAVRFEGAKGMQRQQLKWFHPGRGISGRDVDRLGAAVVERPLLAHPDRVRAVHRLHHGGHAALSPV
jgi:VanZ family protein